MNTIKKILTLLMLVIFVFAFFISVTEMPAKAGEEDGEICNESKTKYCWQSLPDWLCHPDVGADPCKGE